ncbi:hypothetical protein [Chitinophaga sp.]|uniref:hypothetical protein n=1 Tax=Chitinophaga sp. TaxID=1869181 RepID=UPI002F92008B
MQSVVYGKSVLFIGPVFYHYHVALKEEMEEKGAKVSFFPERDYGLKFGFSKRLGPKYFQRKQDQYYHRILEQTQSVQFDYFFLIKGESLSSSFIKVLRERNPGIKCIQYQWDSAKRNNYLHLLDSFDKTITFDSADAQKYNLPYHPLFYTREIAAINAHRVIDYDLLMIGTYLPERTAALQKIIKFCNEQSLVLKYHVFLNKVHYYMQLAKGKRINRDITSFESLSYKEVLNLYARSNVIIDLSNVNQSGLSMRVIEALGAGKKLITTNKQIVHESFYDEDYIRVINIDSPVLDKEFIKKRSSSVNQEIKKLHISTWLEGLFELVDLKD